MPKRKPIRLENFHYGAGYAYFITVCTKDRAKILSKITVGDGVREPPNLILRFGEPRVLDVPKTELTKCGEIVEKYILSTNKINNVCVDRYVIMPNHIHMIIRIEGDSNDLENGTSRAPSPTNKTIPHIVSTLKRFCNKEIGESIFQRSFYDHVIRGREDYEEIAGYIYKNPLNWENDELY